MTFKWQSGYVEQPLIAALPKERGALLAAGPTCCVLSEAQGRVDSLGSSEHTSGRSTLHRVVPFARIEEDWVLPEHEDSIGLKNQVWGCLGSPPPAVAAAPVRKYKSCFHVVLMVAYLRCCS